MNFIGPVAGSNYLIIIDALTKWTKVYKMKTFTSQETEEKLRDAFSRWGIPEIIVSDNARDTKLPEKKRHQTRHTAAVQPTMG